MLAYPPGSGPRGRIPWAPLSSTAFVAGAVFLATRKSPKLERRRLLVLVAVLGLMASGLSACGGGFPGTKVAKNYTITVTGTSGNLQHTTSVTLTVQ
jgi:hypothetical protein